MAGRKSRSSAGRDENSRNRALRVSLLGMSSTTNLLQGEYLRYAVWMCGVMTLIGNTILLTNRCFKHQPSKFIIDIFVNHLAGDGGRSMWRHL